MPFCKRESVRFMWCVRSPIKVKFSGCTRLLGQTLIVVACVSLFLTGCGKRQESRAVEQVYTNRANDKAYIASLMTNRQQQVKEGHLRVEISRKMTQCVARVRATLPAEATEESLQKALADDAEWKALDAQAKEAEAAAAATLKQAEDLIRKRKQEELQANQAVAQGKAKALDGDLPSKPVNKKK